MVLKYYHGPNFGDALNPMIFNKFIGDLFDHDSSIEFFGIGSLIGLDSLNNSKAKKKIIFSTGFGEYGPVPVLDKTYEISCLRGPLTAKKLNVDPSLAITDGAALLKFFEFPKYKKEFKFSYMPHHESEHRYNWRNLCNEADINYISPTEPIDIVIQKIIQTETLITEAMHGAIVADTLRIPWIPVKAYSFIRDFKWMDWALSMDVPYLNNRVYSLYDNIEERVNLYKALSKDAFHSSLYNFSAGVAVKANDLFFHRKSILQFKKLKNSHSYLSKDGTLKSKTNLLLDKLDLVKNTYCKR